MLAAPFRLLLLLPPRSVAQPSTCWDAHSYAYAASPGTVAHLPPPAESCTALQLVCVRCAIICKQRKLQYIRNQEQ
jgi:hypothetical protein